VACGYQETFIKADLEYGLLNSLSGASMTGVIHRHLRQGIDSLQAIRTIDPLVVGKLPVITTAT